MKPFAKSILTSAIVCMPVAAETVRDLGSHEHGGAVMNVVLADDTVFIEFDTPWVNLVGFEHAPATEQQHESVETALEVLNRPDELFNFVGADCDAGIVASLENSMGLSAHDEEHHEEHDEKHDEEHDDAHGEEHDEEHHDDGHGEEHDEEHHDDHGDEHDEDHHDDHSDGDGHSDKESDDHDHSDAHGEDDHGDHEGHVESHSSVLIGYEFPCASSWPDAINTELFSNWAGIEEIDVQLVGPGGQTATELVPTEALIDLSQVR